MDGSQGTGRVYVTVNEQERGATVSLTKKQSKKLRKALKKAEAEL